MSPADKQDGRKSSVLSSEIFVIPLDSDRFIVYAPLRCSAFVANGAAVRQIAELQDHGVEALPGIDESLLGLLRHLKMWEGGEEPTPPSGSIGRRAPSEVTLFLTTSCNLRCAYCYASAGDRVAENMPLDVARKAIDYVASNAAVANKPEIKIAYHGGGEPTVNWPVLTGSFEYGKEAAAKLGLGIKGSVATNGFLDEYKTDWIISNLASASVSFDGLPASHDLTRRTAAGTGSSERVASTLRRMDASGFKYGIRMTVTVEQIPLLAASVDFICANFKPNRIQIEPVYQLGRWKDQPSAETSEFIDAYREARQLAAGHGHNIMFSGARLGLVTNHFCAATEGLFCVSAKGNVSACYEVFAEDCQWAGKFFWGKPDDSRSSFQFDDVVLRNLNDQAVEKREFCSGCFARWSCGGDCYHKSLSVTGNEPFAGTDRCHITRELTIDQLLDKIANNGGLYWLGG